MEWYDILRTWPSTYRSAALERLIPSAVLLDPPPRDESFEKFAPHQSAATNRRCDILFLEKNSATASMTRDFPVPPSPPTNMHIWAVPRSSRRNRSSWRHVSRKAMPCFRLRVKDSASRLPVSANDMVGPSCTLADGATPRVKRSKSASVKTSCSPKPPKMLHTAAAWSVVSRPGSDQLCIPCITFSLSRDALACCDSIDLSSLWSGNPDSEPNIFGEAAPVHLGKY